MNINNDNKITSNDNLVNTEINNNEYNNKGDIPQVNNDVNKINDVDNINNVDKIKDVNKTDDNNEVLPLKNEVKEQSKKIVETDKSKKEQNIKKVEKKSRDYKKIISILLGVIAFILFILVIFFPIYQIPKIAQSSFNQYIDSKDTVSQNTKDKISEVFSNYVEEKNHVSSNLDIKIGNIKEQANLEVLKISHVAYVVEDAKNNDKKMTVWMAIPGEGTFIVDLKSSEFIVDSIRKTVKIKVPIPKLQYSIIYEDKEILFMKDEPSIFSSSSGGKISDEINTRLENMANKEIESEFTSNANYFNSAKNSTISLLQQLINRLNPNIEGINVEVEFTE